MDKPNLQPTDIKSTRQALYGERKLHPTNPKAKNYVHDALEDFDVKINKDEKFFKLTMWKMVIIINLNLECLCSNIYLWMEPSNVVQNSISNCISYMDLRMEIMLP